VVEGGWKQNSRPLTAGSLRELKRKVDKNDASNQWLRLVRRWCAAAGRPKMRKGGNGRDGGARQKKTGDWAAR